MIGVEDMTREELAIKCLLNTCGYDIIKSHGKYHLFGKFSQISAIEKEDVDNLINKAVEVLDLVATKLDYENHEKIHEGTKQIRKTWIERKIKGIWKKLMKLALCFFNDL